MYSPVPGIGRELSKPLLIDGKELPAGTVIVISLRTLNHNPEVWENPEVTFQTVGSIFTEAKGNKFMKSI